MIAILLTGLIAWLVVSHVRARLVRADVARLVNSKPTTLQIYNRWRRFQKQMPLFPGGIWRSAENDLDFAKLPNGHRFHELVDPRGQPDIEQWMSAGWGAMPVERMVQRKAFGMVSLSAPKICCRCGRGGNNLEQRKISSDYTQSATGSSFVTSLTLPFCRIDCAVDEETGNLRPFPRLAAPSETLTLVSYSELTLSNLHRAFIEAAL